MRTTVQGSAWGLKQGFGLGLGSVLGGALYSSLGPRMCFRISAALPSVSLLLLVTPPWIKGGGAQSEELAVEQGLEHWESIRSPRVHQRECW